MRRIIAATTGLLCAAWLALPVGHAQGQYLDVTPFGRPLTEREAVGVQWTETRRIARVEVSFAGEGMPMPSPESMRVEYWHRHWDGGAIQPYVERNAGAVGWAPHDDWTNGQWKTADARVRLAGRKAIFTFASSEEKEFPELKRPGVTYRATLKVQVAFTGPHPKVESLRTFTDSLVRATELAIRFEKRDRCDDALEVYNGRWVGKGARVERGACVLRATVEYAHNPKDRDADRTIVTVRSPSNPFSFAVDEVARGERIYVRDFGVLVTEASDPVTIAEHRRRLEESRAKSVYDRVEEHAEQTLSGAWNDMPLKRPYYFVLGCEGGRQRFRLNANGDIWVGHPNYAAKKPGKDNARFLWPDGMTYHFGLPDVQFADRFLAEGYLPIVTTRWLDGDLLYEQEAFVDLLAGNLNAAPAMQGDDPTVAFLKFRLVNNSVERETARLTFTTESHPRQGDKPGRFESLRANGDRIMGSFAGREVLRFLIDTRGAGRLTNVGDGVRYELELSAHREHTLYLKLPFITLTEEQEIEQLRSLSPEHERAEVARYWQNRVAAGAQIRTPESWLNDFYKAHLTHLLINNEREVGSARYVARVGSFSYGAYGNESIMMISDLDRRGYAKEAERSLDLFLHYQGTVALPGNYNTQKGVFYGAGGYEAGGYNQHHGWILWGMAEHYRYTRDGAWMERAAPHLVEAIQWITNQRKATKKLDAQGNHVLEYGLLPAGSLEDVTDFWFWLSTNAFSWWGMAKAAAALKDFGHPQGAAFVEEAEAYRQDILRAFHEAMVRSPVVRLRDGTYVPYFPSEAYTRGRSLGWVRETLEGSIMLIVTRLLDPNSREAEWILKDFEDNRYISDRYGYSVPVFDQFWFSRGGFSFQPNLLNGPLPYLYRDQIKHFVRAYFNAFASAFDPTLRMLCEHPLPELGYIVGDHFKSSDEAQSTNWLRLMFVMELDDALHLGRGIPRYWLRDGETIGIWNASTHFGKLSYSIRSNLKDGKITMLLDPPDRNSPKAIIVRFRHPESKPIKRVTANGTEWRDFDAAQGNIRLPGIIRGRTAVVAEY